ncbi:hypothetical protein Btru_032557 [Bulinus truncatus]|nr:hypothetical protein Btru_032557 [Bulinus truncatus]
MNTTYVGSTTNTFLALDYARTTSFSAAQGTRSGVPHIAVVMTDGFSSNFQETQLAAQRLKDSGVVVMAIGIGLFNRTELDVIASNTNLVKQVGSYEVLQELHTDVSVMICNKVLNNTCTSLKVADIIIVMDSSTSIGANNFREQLRFAANLTQNFAIGPNDVRFAALTFGSTVNKLFDLDSYSSHDAIYRAITGATYQGSGTNTAMALKYITDNNMFGAAHGGRDGATKIIITLTDGVSDNQVNTSHQATYLKERGYHMMAIGIGRAVNTTELVTLSTDVRNIFIADSFDVLSRLQQEVFVQTCQIPSQTNAGDLWNVCLEQNWRNGIHAHPFDCTKFIECTYLHTAVLHCPSSLVYDPLKETCMYKHDAISCFDYNDYNPFPNYTTSIPPTVPTNIDVSHICTTNHWPDGTHPHPYDCSVYLTCKNGATTQESCPGRTVYDPTSNSCKDPAVAQPCNDAHHLSTQPIIVGPSTNTTAMMSICYDYNLPDGIYPDPGSCVHYVECSNGNTFHMMCPEGLEFNTKLDTCDDVHMVNCNDNYGYVFTVHAG